MVNLAISQLSPLISGKFIKIAQMRLRILNPQVVSFALG